MKYFITVEIKIKKKKEMKWKLIFLRIQFFFYSNKQRKPGDNPPTPLNFTPPKHSRNTGEKHQLMYVLINIEDDKKIN